MKKIFVLSVILLVALGTAGCQEQSIKSSSGPAQPEIVVEDEKQPELDQSPKPVTDCSTLNPHPIAQGMEEKFNVSYDEIMGWYCGGSAFSDILLALETEKLAEISVPELLSMVKIQPWEEIWGELGVSPH